MSNSLVNLGKMPLEIVYYGIGRYLPFKNCASLALTCKVFANLLKDSGFLRQRAFDLRLNTSGVVIMNSEFFKKNSAILAFVHSLGRKSVFDWMNAIINGNHYLFLQAVLEGKLQPSNCAEIGAHQDQGNRKKNSIYSSIVGTINYFIARLWHQDIKPEGEVTLCLSPEMLRDIFSEVVRCESYIDCLRVIVQSSRFNEIIAEALGDAVKDMIASGQTQGLKLIMESSRFADVSDGYLIRGLRIPLVTFPYSENVEDKIKVISCMKLVIESTRFETCGLVNFNWYFSIIAKRGYVEVLTSLMKSSRFVKLQASALDKIFEEVAKRGHKGCVDAIIGCNRFAEIPNTVLKKAFKAAKENGHAECATAISHAAQFKEMDQ